MEPKTSLSAILKHNQKTYLLQEWPKENLKLTEVEKLIIESRLAGWSFIQLDDDSIKHATDQIMLKGAAICGCPLPQTEFFADVISEEITAFLQSMGYGELTLNEIILAMRLNSKGGLRFPTGIEVQKIQFTGNCFNVDFLASVLSNYFSLRTILDQKFKNFISGY